MAAQFRNLFLETDAPKTSGEARAQPRPVISLALTGIAKDFFQLSSQPDRSGGFRDHCGSEDFADFLLSAPAVTPRALLKFLQNVSLDFVDQ